MLLSLQTLKNTSLVILISSAVSFAEDNAPQPNNSKVNRRDRSAGEMTSQDQGASKGDINLTRRIRREVVKQNAFSIDAKNIKIISMNGTVTLKGPVKSVSEKDRIEKIAQKIAGNSRVVSEIEIVRQ